MQANQGGIGSSGGVDPALRETGYIISAVAPGTAQLLSAIFNIAVIMLGWISVVWEVFFRYDFGERYLSWLRLFFAYAMISTLWWIYALLNPSGIRRSDSLFVWSVVFFIGFSVYHRIRIWLRYQNGIPWHSMSFGTSRLSDLNLPVIGNDDWTLYRWYEPIICFILAFVLGRLDPIAGFVGAIAAFALLIKNHMVYFQQRGRILDLIDARLEAAFYNEAAYQKRKEDIAGIAVMKVVWPKMPDVPAGMEAINETVRSTLESEKPAPPPPPSPSQFVPPADYAKTIDAMLGTSDQPPNSDEGDERKE
jgi:hypothetical protein